MFGLFKKKLTAKDIIITNKGFHAAWNYCRNTFDHRLHDDYSNTTYQNIIINLLESLKRGANDDELCDTVLDGFELVSPNGSPRSQFIEVAQNIADSLNNGGDAEARRNAKENRFNVKNIEESIRMAKENIPDMKW